MFAGFSFIFAFVVFITCERVLNAVLSLIERLITGEKTSVKGYASVQLLGASATYVTSILSAIGGILSGIVANLAIYGVWAVGITFIFVLLYVLQQYYPELVIDFVELWNTDIGKQLTKIVVFPLQVLDLLFSALIPIYNYFVWIFVQFFFNIFLRSAANDMIYYKEIAVSLSDMCIHLIMSLTTYIETLLTGCDKPVTDMCYDVGRRTFDFVTPISDLREISISISYILHKNCATLGSVTNIILYPLIDINFAKGVHNLFNSVLFTVFQVPTITLLRCANNKQDFIMCLPDFDPPFDMLSAGLRNIGSLLDNWLDVSSIIVQDGVGLDTGSTACEQVPLALAAANYSRVLFGTNKTTIVGLTDGLYAVTDGVHVQYFNHYDRVESVSVSNAWPIQIDIDLGLAAVTYYRDAGERDALGNPSTTILGCVCNDNNGLPPMEITCAMVLLGAESYSNASLADLTFNVVFQHGSTANYMACHEAEISVQSVRWPATRFTKAYVDSSELDDTCQSKGICSEVDATIWVAPLCTSRADRIPEVCAPSFKYASCFPYCMAARRSGSASEGQVLYNAIDWKDSVTLMNRDCGTETGLRDAVAGIISGTVSYVENGTKVESVKTMMSTTIENDILRGYLRISNWDPVTMGCTQNKLARSQIGVDLHPGYQNNAFRSLLMPGQPFSFAGDTTLTSVIDSAGNYFVKVDRLYGSESNEFTMVNVLKEFPANPPAETVAMGESETNQFERLPTPYAFSDMGGIRHPSVSTQSAVFFVVNPSVAMFKGFASGCLTGGMRWLTQLSALSSYAPIRIWKIEPYIYCPVGNDGRVGCEPGHVAYKDIPDAFTEVNDGKHVFDIQKCSTSFSVMVTRLEYINAENIAVVVLKAPFTEFDAETGALIEGATQAKFEILFLSTVTMALSSTPWERDIRVAAFSQGQLCPNMRRFPNIGSMSTEWLNSGVSLVRLFTNIVISLPGLVKIWSEEQTCSIVTHGHSLLRKCGSDLLSLDNFFDSLIRANAHYWRAYGMVAARVRDAGSDQIARIIDGIAYYGDAKYAPIGFDTSIMRTVRLPIAGIGSGVMMGVFPTGFGAVIPSFGNGMAMNGLRVAQFSYNLITSCITRLIPLIIRVDRINDMQAAREILQILNNQLYDARGAYYNAITKSSLQGCAGMSLIMGYSNPWAVLTRKQCEAAPVLLQGLLDLALSIMVEVPFTKCICVDSAREGALVQKYAMDNCYYFAPTHLKGDMLKVIQNGIGRDGAAASCEAMIQYTENKLKDSMQPFFSIQYDAFDSAASTLDYLLSFIDDQGGKCTDFVENPYATVLIPEPLDYFAACGKTSICRTKCNVDISAFELAYANDFTSSMTPQSTVISTKEESLLFMDLNLDAYTPMRIESIVQLLDCSGICGNHEDYIIGNTGVNIDTCIAIAGLSTNSTIHVMKYCIPKSMSDGVTGEPRETWYVWYSEEWSMTVTDIKFSDVVRGDTLIVSRNNKNLNFETGPSEQFISVHPREIQLDIPTYTLKYGTLSDRNQRLSIFPQSSVISGMPSDVKVVGISDMFILPTGGEGRNPWILLHVFVSGSGEGITDSGGMDICIVLDIEYFIDNRGTLSTLPHVCNLYSFFETNIGSSYIPVVLPGESMLNVPVVLIPTIANVDVCVVNMNFISNYELGVFPDLFCYKTPNSFTSNAKFPTIPTWSDISKSTFMGANKYTGVSVLTQGGIALKVSKKTAQNSLVFLETAVGRSTTLNIFITNDPDTPVHWLQQVRIYLKTEENSASNALSEIRSSQIVDMQINIMHTCDMSSCLGCRTLLLQNLCNAAHACAIVKCIGTVVNQNRPLCNLGLAMQSVAQTSFSYVIASWLVLTDSYTQILRLSLQQSDTVSVKLEWIDDAFFGYICASKDLGGQISAIATSAIGAALIDRDLKNANDMSGNAGAKIIATSYSAETAMILNGANSFMYQISLLPLYTLIATQKMMVCTYDSVFAMIAPSGFEVTLGRDDFQNASGAAAGVCLTAFFSRQMENPVSSGTAGSLGSGTADIVSRSGGTSAFRKVNSAEYTSQYANLLTYQQMGPAMHLMDAMITWAIGVVSGLQDMVQQLDSAHCKVVDYYIHNVTTCACGDDAVRIPQERREDREYAHWCRGTLKMIDPFGNVIYVYNPYTYSELYDKVAGMDRYLECISKKSQDGTYGDVPCDSIEPRDNIFTSQRVSPISIFQRCKANYQQKQWDDGAHLLYDEDKFSFHFGLLGVSSGSPSIAIGSVGACLLSAANQQISNQLCMNNLYNLSPTIYWRYVRISETDALDRRNIDACIVFSGPAKNPDPEISLEFQKCSEQFTVTGCKIPQMVYSSGSANRVPVANVHMVDTTDKNERKLQAETLFQTAQENTLDILTSLENFASDNLDVVLFSGEGDSLHQIFDCIMMGPYSKVDMWSKGSTGVLSVPNWARDTGGLGNSRNLDLPCDSSKLNGDFRPPFTCGGSTRKALIKKFVRDYYPNSADGDTGGNSDVINLIKAQVQELKSKWSDITKFACTCADGTSNLECCTTSNRDSSFLDPTPCTGDTDGTLCTNNFLPDVLKEPFDEISASDIIASVMQKIPAFVQDIYTDGGGSSFKRYNDKKVYDSWDWITSGTFEIANSDNMYSTHNPIMNYSVGEVGFPFKNQTSIWHMCTGLISQVMFTMPMRPLVVDQVTGDWMWTAASVLNLRTPSLAFDPTLSKEFAGSTSSGVSMLETYVQKLLENSFQDSSMFWHYALRHVPSESISCAKHIVTNNVPAESIIQFSNSNTDGIPDIDMDRIPSIKMHGYAAHALGTVSSDCFCGWTRVDDHCEIPQDICSDTGYINSQPDCKYEIGTTAGRDIIATALSMWAEKGSWGGDDAHDGRWPCPDIDMSDSWGIVSTYEADNWIMNTASNMDINVADLIAAGRAGLRIGNIDLLLQKARVEGVWPSARIHKLESDDYSSNIALNRCADTILSTFDATSVVDNVIDDLFPVAQGIYESAPISVCLRFSIEFSKLRLLHAISSGIRNITSNVASQEALTTRWRERCEVQLQLLGACKGNSVYGMIPTSEFTDIECPFTISDEYTTGNYYITPGCLVYIKDHFNDQTLTGSFFNPCKHPDKTCIGTESFSLQDLMDAHVQTKLSFDPRAVGSGDVLGTWPIEYNTGTDSGDEAMKSISSNLKDWYSSEKVSIPWRLLPDFVEKVVMDGGKGAKGSAGNTKEDWGTSEGFTKDGSAEFCDGIADWWPEDWTKPIGYHVTVPCNKDQTGYRTYDSAFAVDRGNGQLTVVEMKYQHNSQRDPETFHSQFGTSGFCRKGMYGIPQFVTNTMRICTKDATGVQYDATVPVKPTWDDGVETYGDEYCSQDPYEVPWTTDDPSVTHPSMFSIGNSPLWRGGIWTESGKFPSTDLIPELVNTHPGIPDNSWGASCTDGDLLYCTNDDDCVPMDDAELECFRNTCILKRSTRPSCYRHDDCKDEDKFCSGDGLCVSGIWQVENNFDKAIDFEIYTENCNRQDGSSPDPDFPVEEYDMYGSSSWGKVPDILHMYGMCSYRNWFEYLEFVKPDSLKHKNLGRCGTTENADFECGTDSFSMDSSKWWDSTKPAGEDIMPTFWDSKKFRVHAHECDRDYMHIGNHKGCAPVVLNDNSAMGLFHKNSNQDFASRRAVRNRQIQTIQRKKSINGDDTDRFIDMVSEPVFSMLSEANNKWVDYRKYGFLSLSNMDGDFDKCGDIEQCFVDPFTFNGLVQKRQVVKEDGMQLWIPSDGDVCGIFGIPTSLDNCDISEQDNNNHCCKLDRAILPIYEILCVRSSPSQFAQLVKDCAPSTTAVDSICASIGTVINNNTYYELSWVEKKQNIQLQQKADELNSLINIVVSTSPITTSAQYLKIMKCSTNMYASIQLATACTTSSDTISPFCAPYHIDTDLDASTALPRSGIYYMLRYTMQEIPFAWWHKCMLLQNRKFNGETSIECDNWIDGSIPKHIMLLPTQTYNTDVLNILQRIDGGITDTHYHSTMDTFSLQRSNLVEKYISSGAPVDYSRYASATSDDATRAFARQGISIDFSMECYEFIDYVPKDIMENLLADSSTPIDCMIDILNWVHKDNSDITKFSAENAYTSRGSVGVFQDCIVYRGLFTPSASNQKPPMRWINDTLLMKDSEGSSLMDEAFRENDFLMDRSDIDISDAKKGMLIAELFLPEIPYLRDRPLVDKIVNTVQTDKVDYLQRYADVMTCIALEDVEDRLPICTGEGSILLAEEHCSLIQVKISALIYELARPITSIDEARNTYPAPNDGQGSCYVECGTNMKKDTSFNAYPGIPGKALDTLIDVTRVEEAKCISLAKTETECISIALVNTLEDTRRIPLDMTADSWTEKLCTTSAPQTQVIAVDIEDAYSFNGGSAAAKIVTSGDLGSVIGTAIGNGVNSQSPRKMHGVDCDERSTRTTGNSYVNWAINELVVAFWNPADVWLSDEVSTGEKISRLFGVSSDEGYTKEWDQLFDMETFLDEVIDSNYTGNKNRTTLPTYAGLVDPSPDPYSSQYIREKVYDEVAIRLYRAQLVIRTLSKKLKTGLSTCKPYSQNCIPAERNIQQSDFHEDDYFKECFLVDIPQGQFQCNFTYDKGLSFDIAAAHATGNPKTPITGISLDWNAAAEKMLPADDTSGITKQYNKMVYTLYIAMVKRMMDPVNKDLTTKYIKPVAIDFFDTHREQWLNNYSHFDITVDTETEIHIDKMGQNCDTGATVIDYGVCNPQVTTLYDSARSMFERSHVKDSAIIVPASHILVWPGIPFIQHVSSTLPAWSMHARRDSESRVVFSDWIFDKSTQCSRGTLGNSICTQINGVQTAMNPWLGGDFNPWEKCDTYSDTGTNNLVSSSGTYIETTTNEAIHVTCNPVVCDSDPTLNSAYYANQPNTNCLSSRDIQVEKVNVPSSFASNLCRQKPNPSNSECTWKQGMMQGGLKGKKLTDGTRSSEDMLYTDQLPQYTSDELKTIGMGLFFNGGNPLYYTSKGTPAEIAEGMHTIIKQNKEDLGGHHIIFKTAIDKVTSEEYMYIDKAPLTAATIFPKGSNPSPSWSIYQYSLQSTSTNGNYGWLSNLAANMRYEENFVLQNLYPITHTKTNSKWSCPLRRMAFWTKLVSDFNPLVPSPVRAARIFGGEVNMIHGTRSHPTQVFRKLTRVANVLTSNGFCFCVDNTDCQIPNKDNDDHSCSLVQTIKSLYDMTYRPATLLTHNDAICTEQLDWPFEGGEMRDGTVSESRNAAGDCNVIDRLPPFQYRYIPNGKIYKPSSQRTTLDEGGSCHMGPASRIPSDLNSNIDTRDCRTIHKNYTHIVARCALVQGLFEDIEMIRERSEAPTWMSQHFKKERQKCDTCSGIPLWKTEKTNQELPNGPEVSYGIPFRWSAARLLAVDIQRIICGTTSGVYNQCTDLLNIGEWSLDKFIGNFMDSSSKLFSNEGNINSVLGKNILEETYTVNGKPDESLLWDGPDAAWVACNQYNGTCYGGISKETWYSDKKTETCISVFTQMVADGKVNESTAGLDICNLNADLNKMCLGLKSAQTMVFEGNCIYAGDCSPKIALYTPSIYSITNGDFVRGTVSNYYETYTQKDTRAIDGTRVVCPLDSEEIAMRSRNDEYTSECASKQLQVLKIALYSMRKILHILVQGAFIIINLVLNILRLCIQAGSDTSDILGAIKFWFMKMISLLIDTLKVVGDMAFSLIFDTGGLGAAMKTIVKALCDWVDWIYSLWDTVWCFIIHTIAQPIVDGLATALDDAANLLPGLGIEGPRDKLRESSREMNGITCTHTNLCRFPEEPPPEVPSGALPVASRCWANYIPSIDDTNAFSCSRSDTCRTSTMMSGNNFDTDDFDFLTSAEDSDFMVCDSCPRNKYVNQFGCNTYTQKCTCSQPVLDRTFCTTNSQCYQQGDYPSICSLVNDFSTGGSYGSIECQQCSSSSTPTCHILKGNGVGICSCMQQGTPIQSCMGPLGDRIMPDASQMCAVSTDPGTSASTNVYYDWNDLATTPCVLISSGSAYCYTVGSYGNLVVGHGVIRSSLNANSRRLLQMAPHNNTLVPNHQRYFTYTPVINTTTDKEANRISLMVTVTAFQNWTHVTDPCSSLALSYMEGADIGILGEYKLADCVHWREVGNDTIREMNLTKLGTNDHFLMSLTDFSTSVMEKGVFKQLLDTNGVMMYIISKMKIIQPMKKIIRRITDNFLALHIEKILELMNYTSFSSPLNNTNITLEEKNFRSFIQNQQHVIKYLMPYMHSVDISMLRNFTANETLVDEVLQTLAQDTLDIEKAFKGSKEHKHRIKASNRTHFSHKYNGKILENSPVTMSHTSKRRILQSDPISEYSSIVGQTDEFSNILLGDAIAQTWLQGPFGWPPKYNMQSDGFCSAGSSMLNIMYENGLVLRKFYEDDYSTKVRNPAWDIQSNIPKLYTGNKSAVSNVSAYTIEGSRSNDWVATYFLTIGNGFLKPVLGITPQGIKEFFTHTGNTTTDTWTFNMFVNQMVSCDFESVMLCSRHNRNIVISFIISCIIYLLLSQVMKIFQLSSIIPWLLLAIIPMTMWLAYGMSPLCLPMVPTCFVQDIIAAIQILFPERIVWPNAIQVYPGCVAATKLQIEDAIFRNKEIPSTGSNSTLYPNIQPGSKECMLSCTDAPFHFRSWESSLSWILCGIDSTACQNFTMPYFEEVEHAIYNHSMVLKNAYTVEGEDMLHAFQFCFWVTLCQAIPWGLLLLFILYVLLSLLKLPFVLLASGVQCFVQIVAYSHAD